MHETTKNNNSVNKSTASIVIALCGVSVVMTTLFFMLQTLITK